MPGDRQHIPSLRWSTRLALAWTALILILTLLPGARITGPLEDLPSAWCLVCGERGAADGILNVLLFVPLGIALMASTGRALLGVAVIAALTISIEVLQGVIPGRYQALGDVVYNTVGGSAGVALFAIGKTLLWPGGRVTRALTLAAGTAAGSVFLLTGLLLTPSFPDTVYYGQWTADLHYMEAYQGQVIEASLGSMPLKSEKTSDPERAVSLLRSGASLDVRAEAGPAPPALAPILSILDQYAVEILVLGADRADLVLRVRYRADEFRLDRPDLRVRGALAATAPGDTMRLRAQVTSGGVSLALDQHEFAPRRHTPGEGWALLLHPGHTAPWVDSALDIAWVAGLLILAGWWAPGIGWVAAALALAVSGMAIAAFLGPLTSMATIEILAAFGGIMVGVLLRRTFIWGSRTPPPNAT
jgi:hypothetical protein